MANPEQESALPTSTKTSFGIGDALFHGLAASVAQTAVWLKLLAQLRGQTLERDAAIDEAYEWFHSSSERLRRVLPSASEVLNDVPPA
jgi:hypothetical protein